MDFSAINSLVKALEAGSYNAAPSTLVQGAALQVENLSPVLQNVTFDDSHLKLQQMLSVKSCKSMLVQFDRQLSYGHVGGSAQLEGHVGQEATSDFVRVVVPMCFYSHTRRVTIASTMIDTVDGKKSDERAASDAAKKIAFDVEYDLFRGRADFSNAGVFDGNPLTLPSLMANMMGVDVQVRQSDVLRNARDLMFAEYGSDDSIIISGGGTLTQEMVEDASVRSAMNMGNADKLVVDPKVLSNYNKIALGKERIILAGSPQEGTGSDLRKQWVSGGTVSVEASRFLSGKTAVRSSLPNGPVAPTVVATPAAISGATTTFTAGQVYIYFATSENEIGESPASATSTATIVTAGHGVNVVITHGSGTNRFFNVYRTAAGGAAATAKFIGRVLTAAGASTTTFVDIGNKLPGFVTGFLIQRDTMEINELAPYSRLKLAQTELSLPESHFRFLTLAVFQPRKNCIIDNLR